MIRCFVATIPSKKRTTRSNDHLGDQGRLEVRAAWFLVTWVWNVEIQKGPGAGNPEKQDGRIFRCRYVFKVFQLVILN